MTAAQYQRFTKQCQKHGRCIFSVLIALPIFLQLITGAISDRDGKSLAFSRLHLIAQPDTNPTICQLRDFLYAGFKCRPVAQRQSDRTLVNKGQPNVTVVCCHHASP